MSNSPGTPGHADRRSGVTALYDQHHPGTLISMARSTQAGGNLSYLQRILGHSTLEMTNRYVRSLKVEDLQAVHNRLSLVARS